MRDINQTIQIGRLTREPELKMTSNGKTVIKFSIAVNGFKENEVNFFDVEYWTSSTKIGDYLKKGTQVAVFGRLKQDQWQDKDGNKRSKIKIVAEQLQLLGGKKDVVQPALQEQAGPSNDSIPF
jgi:single-strand DNA-binding protein